jgi:hypothetical protein
VIIENRQCKIKFSLNLTLFFELGEFMNIIIGTPIHPKGAFALEHFLRNQQEIQVSYPTSELIFATSVATYAEELQKLLNKWNLNGKVLIYTNDKPEWAKSRIWDIAAGREAIRKHVLSNCQARAVVFLDADMTYDPDVIQILEKSLTKSDVIFSGYPRREFGITLSGFGCVIFSRNILKKLIFRCCEFKNGDFLSEDEILDFDLFRLGSHITKGIFVSIKHYVNSKESYEIHPQKAGFYKLFSHNLFIRYCLIQTSLIAHCNIPLRIKTGLYLINRKIKIKNFKNYISVS